MKLTDVRFTDLNLPEELMRGVHACGWDVLTEVQARSLPITLEGRDLGVQAQTGSGKTAVFLITAFTHMLHNPRQEGNPGNPRTLIITPTRELAAQVARDATELGRFLPFRIHAVYGGIDYGKQRSILREGVDLLVGTPGRLIDYLKQRVYDLHELEIAVIDEADRLFDMGFIADVRWLMRRMSRYDRRQSMLFSATLGHRVIELAYSYMNVPELIEITPEQITAEKVEQLLYHVGAHEKFSLFLGLLGREEWSKALVFVNTKWQARELRDRLEANGYPAMVLSGDVDQVRRLKILKRFMTGEARILVATDVASRGLHIEAISHVFNYDLPQDPEDYVHRIGRTARAGASGKAVTLADENYVLALDAVEKYIGREIPVAWADDDLFLTPIEPPRRSRRERDRRSEGESRGGERRPRDRSDRRRAGRRNLARPGRDADFTGSGAPEHDASSRPVTGDNAHEPTVPAARKKRRRRKPRQAGIANED
jgi:ATP-dependent RNA helicase RhlB